VALAVARQRAQDQELERAGRDLLATAAAA
jgi:hypothetical protein